MCRRASTTMLRSSRHHYYFAVFLLYFWLYFCLCQGREKHVHQRDLVVISCHFPLSMPPCLLQLPA